jgi:hypothetical protein
MCFCYFISRNNRAAGTALSVAGKSKRLSRVDDPPAASVRFTRGRVPGLKNGHNSVTVQNRTHVHMNFFHHKDLGNHLLQLCPKVVKHPVVTVKKVQNLNVFITKNSDY